MRHVPIWSNFCFCLLYDCDVGQNIPAFIHLDWDNILITLHGSADLLDPVLLLQVPL